MPETEEVALMKKVASYVIEETFGGSVSMQKKLKKAQVGISSLRADIGKISDIVNLVTDNEGKGVLLEKICEHVSKSHVFISEFANLEHRISQTYAKSENVSA